MKSHHISSLFAVVLLVTVAVPIAAFSGVDGVVRAIRALPAELDGSAGEPHTIVPFGMNGSYSNWDIYNICDQEAATFTFQLGEIPADAISDTLAEGHDFAEDVITTLEESDIATPNHTDIRWHNPDPSRWVAPTEKAHFGYQIGPNWNQEPSSIGAEWTLEDQSPCPIPETKLKYWETPAAVVVSSPQQQPVAYYDAIIENRSTFTLTVQRRALNITETFALDDLTSQGKFSQRLATVDSSPQVLAPRATMVPHTFTCFGDETGLLMVYTVTNLIRLTPVPQYVAWEAIGLDPVTITPTPTITSTPTPGEQLGYGIYLPIAYSP